MKILNVNGYEVKVDDDLYELLKSKTWRVINRGTKYIADCNGRYMHRLIMGLTDPEVFVDHIDRDTMNNQRSNLRPCTRTENRWNTNPISKGKSMYKGVHPAYVKKKDNKIRWTARIKVGSKYTSLGYFKTEEEAAKAYNIEAIKHHGDFASLNVITQP